MHDYQLIAATIARLSDSGQIAAREAMAYDEAVEILRIETRAMTKRADAAVEDGADAIAYAAAASALNEKCRELADTAMQLHAQVLDEICAL